MIQTTPHVKIYAAVEPINFQKRMDGTAAICRQRYRMDPYTGTYFVFINKKKTMIRVYFFDGQGEWLCDKRIAKGKFPHWVDGEYGLSQIESQQLYVLLRGGDPGPVVGCEDWRKIA